MRTFTHPSVNECAYFCNFQVWAKFEVPGPTFNTPRSFLALFEYLHHFAIQNKYEQIFETVQIDQKCLEIWSHLLRLFLMR